MNNFTNNYFPFLKWWLQICLVLTGVLIAIRQGLYYIILEQNNLSGLIIISLICAILISMTIYCGQLSWSARSVRNYYFVRVRLEDGWFASNLCMNLGMIGTIIGFVMMLGEFSTVDISKIHTVQNLIKTLGTGVGVALWTTLIGLISATLVRIQFYILQKNVQ